VKREILEGEVQMAANRLIEEACTPPPETVSKIGLSAQTKKQIEEAITFLESPDDARNWPLQVLLNEDSTAKKGTELKNAKKCYRGSTRLFKVVNDVLYRTERRAKIGKGKEVPKPELLTVIPKEDVMGILQQLHAKETSGHVGIVKM
jgi:hypothetical protein